MTRFRHSLDFGNWNHSHIFFAHLSPYLEDNQSCDSYLFKTSRFYCACTNIRRQDLICISQSLAAQMIHGCNEFFDNNEPHATWWLRERAVVWSSNSTTIAACDNWKGKVSACLVCWPSLHHTDPSSSSMIWQKGILDKPQKRSKRFPNLSSLSESLLLHLKRPNLRITWADKCAM